MVYAFLYLMVQLLPSNGMETISHLLGFILLAGCLLTVRSFNRWISLILIAIGTVIFWLASASPTKILESISTNRGVVSLMFAAPMISIAMESGGYLEALQQKLALTVEKRKNVAYKLTQILMLLLSPFLNIGAAILAERIAVKSMSEYYLKTMMMTIHRSFGASLYWSPFSASMILITLIYGLKWQTFVVWLIPGCLCHIVLTYFFTRWTRFDNDRWMDLPLEREVRPDGRSRMKVPALAMWVGGLIVLSMLLEIWTPFSMVPIITFLSMIYSFLWMQLTRNVRPFWWGSAKYAVQSFPRSQNEMMILLSAGYFGVAASSSHFGGILNHYFSLIYSISAHLWIATILLLFITTSFLGIHGVVVLTIIASTFDLKELGIDPVFATVVLLFGNILANQLSPYSANAQLTAKFTGEHTYTIIRKNALFTFYMFICMFLLSMLVWRIRQ